MSRARFTACHLPWTADSDCACLSPGERTQKGEKPGKNGQEPAATTESAGAKRRCALQPGSFIAGVQRAPVTARQSGAAGTAAASVGVASGMETRWPEGTEGPGRDSLAGSVRSMTARPDARRRPEKTFGITPQEEDYFFRGEIQPLLRILDHRPAAAEHSAAGNGEPAPWNTSADGPADLLPPPRKQPACLVIPCLPRLTPPFQGHPGQIFKCERTMCRSRREYAAPEAQRYSPAGMACQGFARGLTGG